MVQHTARYKITRLIYVETFETAPDAIAREKQLKKWRREKKLILINRSNPEWRDGERQLSATGLNATRRRWRRSGQERR